LDKLEPFINAYILNSPNQCESLSPDDSISTTNHNIKSYLELPDLKSYYLLNESSTLLENLRNRFVLGHPHITVVLDDLSHPEGDIEVPLIADEEGKKFYEIWRKINSSNPMKTNSSRKNKLHRGLRKVVKKPHQTRKNGNWNQASAARQETWPHKWSTPTYQREDQDHQMQQQWNYPIHHQQQNHSMQHQQRNQNIRHQQPIIFQPPIPLIEFLKVPPPPVPNSIIGTWNNPNLNHNQWNGHNY